MYEDSWYSFVPDTQPKRDDKNVQKSQHRRRESLLKQPNDNGGATNDQSAQLGSLFEESQVIKGPPEATLVRRAKSYSDFYHVARAQITKDSKKLREREQEPKKALNTHNGGIELEYKYDIYDDSLLEASQEEFRLYRDQLTLTERHLGGLLEDTTIALELLARLSSSFKSVESETTSFQNQCEDLLEEQKRLKGLANEVGVALQYYSYLEPITRRLNAPGASRVIGSDSFVEMLMNLDACIEFMVSNPEHRESENYLTRYKSLLERALNLIEIKFTNSIQERTAESRKRLDPDNFTMTNAFLAQAPGSHPTPDLGYLIEFIVSQTRLVDEQNRQTSEPSPMQMKRNAPALNSKHAANENLLPRTYIAYRTNLIERYVKARSPLTSDVIELFLKTSNPPLPFSPEEFLKWAHGQIDAILEICGTEYSKYELGFISKTGDPRNYDENVDFSRFSIRHLVFLTFVREVSSKATGRLEVQMTQADMHTGIALIMWLDNHFKDSTEDQGDESPLGEQRIGHLNWSASEGFSKRFGEKDLKARLALELKGRLVLPIFNRMKEILLRDVEHYIPKPEDLSLNLSSRPQPDTSEVNQSVVEKKSEPVLATDIEARAAEALGPGWSSAYPALKTAFILLIHFYDLTYDSKNSLSDVKHSGELAYEIMHKAFTAIMHASDAIVAKKDPVGAHLFAIKNLVLLKNLVLAYEISGTSQAAALDFTRMWTTFSNLRSRGGLFDIAAYYRLLRTGELLPEVVTSVKDAQVELDGQLRETIMKFRESCAVRLWNQKSKGPAKDAWKVKTILQGRIEQVFEHEPELRANLWAAVEETVEEKKKG